MHLNAGTTANTDAPLALGLVGLGKMGLSHLAIANTHPGARVVAVCDPASYVTETLSRYSGIKGYTDFAQILQHEPLHAIIISTPSRLHGEMVRQSLERGLHVFCEKPLVLDPGEGEALAASAEHAGVVNQVGYHFRYVAAFQEARRVVQSGALGAIQHCRVEAYGAVVLRARGRTWRAEKLEGGGALYDYACHAVDLVNFVFATPHDVSGVAIRSVFSTDVDDEVYCTLHFPGGANGQLAVNWSDESFRKMSMRITVWGTRGRLSADRQECQIFLRQVHEAVPDLVEGWNSIYTTGVTRSVWFYLRGEEYSAQLDDFVRAACGEPIQPLSTFRTAVQTDRVIDMIRNGASGMRSDPVLQQVRPRRWWCIWGGSQSAKGAGR